MASLTIRPAAPRDAAAIARVHVASWRETYAGLLPADMLASLDVDARRDMWLPLLSGSPASRTRAFVLESDAGIVGFGACGDQRAPDMDAAGYDGEIGAIYILNVARGRGSGRLLMQQMASLLSERGKKGVSLWVLAGNHEARHFYEHLGGRVAGRREDRRPQAVLTEVAYGWPVVRRLATRGGIPA